MPKMTDEILEEIESGRADEGGGVLLPEGYYLVRLTEVTEEEPRGDAEYGSVKCVWEVLEPQVVPGDGDEEVTVVGSKVFDWLSYSPRAAFRWKRVFDATGYTYDSDLDELVEAEETVILELVQEAQSQGKNKGKMRNKIEMVLEDNEDNRNLVG